MTKTVTILVAAALGSAAAPSAAQYYPQPQPQPQPEPYPQYPQSQYPAPQYPQSQYPEPQYPQSQYPQSQYPQYPQQTYPQQYPAPGYGYGNNTVLGQVIDGLIGNRYNVSDRQAIRQCTFAAVNQAENQYRPYYMNRSFARPYPGYNGYIRVSAITEVQRRAYGVRVRGLLDTGLYRAQPYGYPGGHAGDITFRCDVDYRGYVSNVRIEPNHGYGYGRY
jgi:hypothetical protein